MGQTHKQRATGLQPVTRKRLKLNRRPKGIRMSQNIASTQHLPASPSIKCTAEYLGVSERSVRRWIAQGLIKARRVGPRLIRLDRASVLALGETVGA